ncbi:hypothetical protein A2229_00250 [Candidatus Peregrinibacteria bacterium RIFOXYA2_FULL_33_7]|nr:MAG: hypothetical protein A2229_00250 [Candidatus Peregrinibacteria bacterium RIFOXYA2_FULL_33_7]
MIGHAILPLSPHIANIKNHSDMAIKFGFPVIAGIYMFFTYILLIGSIILLIPFINKDLKSLLFKLSIAISAIWFIGFFEPLFMDEQYLYLLIMAINDSIPTFLLIFFIAKYSKIFQNNSNEKNKNNNLISTLLPAIIIIISFVGIRLISYYLIKMKSIITDRPIETILWTVLFGILIGSIYTIYQKMEYKTYWFPKAFRFAVIFFGINWTMYNFFVIILLRESFADFLLYRAIFDIFAIFIGISLGELLKNKINS